MKLSKKLKSTASSVFHKRNIIIMSDRATSHVSMSGKMQFIMAVSIIGLISAGSYSTGQFMAAQKVIDEQGETIKSVANSRIESNYSYGIPALSSQTAPSEASVADAAPETSTITDPSYTFSGLDEGKLIARISYLENRVRDLKKNNEEIINVVKITADGQIKDLERVIRQTGLSPELLKRQAEQENKIRRKPTAKNADGSTGGQGGPFIPENWDDSMRAFIGDIDKSADQLYILRQILKVMPLAKPIEGASRESPFGRRVDPFNKRIAFHSGLDLASAKPEIFAPVNGKVVFAGWSNGYGNMVELDHGLGISTRYGHLSKINVAVGDVVAKGQNIAMQGSTGRSTGPHLHYEVRFNDRPIDPAPFLNAGSKYVSQK